MSDGGFTNWAGNVRFTAGRLHRPTSVDALRALVADARRLRPLGTGHSFNRIADGPGDQVTVADLPRVMDIDSTAGTVRVSAGLRYGELAPHLHAAGHGLHNLGSLPHISIGGACATGTHGSGDANGCLATAVSAIELVTGGGELVTLRRGEPAFAAAAVGLGAFGVVTALTLDLRPTYDVTQVVYDDLPATAVREHLSEIMAAGYSVSLFTDWSGPGAYQVWVKRLADQGPLPSDWLGARRADEPRHPVPGMSPETCTQQLGVPGPWHARLPHFRLEFTPSSGDELQSEYFVARHDAVAALAALEPLRARIADVVQVSEIRSVAADELWLSPAHRRDSVALHFTWLPATDRVLPLLAAIEEKLAALDARPHWGKLFAADPARVAARYERMPDFAELVRRHDPAGTFRNAMLDRFLPPVD